VRVRDRVAVRVVRRKAEGPVDPGFELLGDHVLEAVSLVVDVVDVQAQGLRQVQLEQAVVPDYLECDPLARRTQARAAVFLVLEQIERRQLLHHRGRGRGRDRQVLRERADRDAPLARLQLVHALQVVLNRVGEWRLPHPYQGNVVRPWPSAWDTAPTPTTPSWSGRSSQERTTRMGASSSRSRPTSRPSTSGRWTRGSR